MSEAAATPTVDDVMDALANVIDPELGLDFVELGLIDGVALQRGGGTPTFTYNPTAGAHGPPGQRTDRGVRRRTRGRQLDRLADGLHAAVVAGEDERGREVRARLLSRLAPRGLRE